MTEAEAKDLEIVKENIKKKKEEAYYYMSHLYRMTPEQIKNCGYSDVGSALINVMIKTEKEVEKIIVQHEKKYPD